MLNEKGMIPKVKGGLSNPWGPLGVFHVSATHLNLCFLLVGSSYFLEVVGVAGLLVLAHVPTPPADSSSSRR